MNYCTIFCEVHFFVKHSNDKTNPKIKYLIFLGLFLIIFIAEGFKITSSLYPQHKQILE